MTRLPKRWTAFTLLEVLVVVSIIALLMGLLLPSLRSARDQSKRLVCKKNLSAIWRGVLVYSMEYSDRVPYLEHISPAADPFDENHPTVVGTVLGSYVDERSFVCPSAVAGYPETNPEHRRKWKLTYDLSTADRVGKSVPYDQAEGAYTGAAPDPAMVNDYHFDGRPMRLLSVRRDAVVSPTDDPAEIGGPEGKAEIIWNVSVPLVADTLAESRPGGIASGRPVYPHRGVVRRRADVYRALLTTSDPRLVSGRRAGYFHLHVENERPEIFLTRYSPDTNPDD